MYFHQNDRKLSLNILSSLKCGQESCHETFCRVLRQSLNGLAGYILQHLDTHSTRKHRNKISSLQHVPPQHFVKGPAQTSSPGFTLRCPKAFLGIASRRSKGGPFCPVRKKSGEGAVVVQQLDTAVSEEKKQMFSQFHL